MEVGLEMTGKQAGCSPPDDSVMSDMKREPVDDSLEEVFRPEFVEIKSEDITDETEWDTMLKEEPLCDVSQEGHMTVKPYPTDYFLQGVTEGLVKIGNSDVNYEIKSEEILDEKQDSESYDGELDKSTVLASCTSSVDQHPTFADIRSLPKHEKPVVTCNSIGNALCGDDGGEDVYISDSVEETCEGASFPVTEAKGSKDKQSGLEEADQDFRAEESRSHERAKEKQTRNAKHRETFSSTEIPTEKRRRMKQSREPILCETCGKSFLTRTRLKIHRVVHTGDKAFQCPVCQKAFTQKASLMVHLRLHSEKRSFMCTVCGKAFTRNDYLIYHMGIHSEERPFECEHCRKRFKAKSVLASHMRIHTGRRSFACSDCGLQFSQSNHLSKHKRFDH